MQQSAPAIRIVSAILLSALWASTPEQSNAQSVKQGSKVDLSRFAASGCDASLWNRVYNPKRLQQLAPCLTVTGVITESSADPDGDQHFLLRLDPGQEKLVNKRNRKKKGGDIVLEIVCANPTTMKKVGSTCAGYTNPIPVPAVGAHVRATGTYVIDSHNGWAEIHPVSRLQAM
jgi:hypothetical protein